ncbi:cupin domain-containing protein [Ketobacter sp. MCCC 1A13808]|uniref:cupin domain-containing protein n=1 Tax=Ketobacter sp. MCCC 1A13808 TaxID=2602738 RepID=UPI000F27FF2D|nr:cupin domain-containing protein [Ketobacter sp. MCCC 1A13808]MVF10604.1 cupin domain-containing protein [Ketobacter sp. MCCC 1A13808]RLP56027.1 MAG: cupin domain-containing protein [Ketobacter sp.]
MTAQPLPILGGMSAEEFLQDYWQKKPLLIRNACPEAGSLMEAEELAGLSLDDTIESRIILERSPIDWELKLGPFDNKLYKNLPPTHWTLLVQAVDHHVPAVSNLLEAFPFIPSWRIDDIMASFATKDGSVGPHFDYYDVFLIQADGQRRWQLGQRCDDQTPLLPNLGIRVLKDFQAIEEWIVNPGDVLYLPPGIAHYGVALNNCMTYSVGFRAPSEHEILSDFVHHSSLHQNQDKRYSDPDLLLQENPGWISPQAVDRVQEILQNMVSDRSQIEIWMAGYLSQTKYEPQPEPPEEDYSGNDVLDLLAENYSLHREESSRLVYIADNQNHPEIFFINGEQLEILPITEPLVLFLCQHRYYDPAQLSIYCRSPDSLALLTRLLNMGVIYFEEDQFQN